jgi:hypothetical protein
MPAAKAMICTSSGRPKSLALCIAVIVAASCTDDSDVRPIGGGHYTVAGHAGDTMKAEMRAMDKSHAYCERRQSVSVIDDPSRYEIVSQNGSGVTVNLRFQCEGVPP